MTKDKQTRKETPICEGQVFGSLTVVSQCEDRYVSPRGKTHIKWNCVCVCGSETTPDTGSLKSGRSKSCGCVLTPEGLIRRQRGRKQDAGAADVYSTYKRQARKRGYAFKLSKDEAIVLFKQRCHYCNSKPAQVAKKCAIPFLYTGIDRVDNSAGYTLANSLPCCGRCNKAKMTLSYNEFLSMIEEVHSNLIGNIYE